MTFRLKCVFGLIATPAIYLWVCRAEIALVYRLLWRGLVRGPGR